MCLIEVTRKLNDSDMPLLLSLSWSDEHKDGLHHKQFVLKDRHLDAIEV